MSQPKSIGDLIRAMDEDDPRYVRPIFKADERGRLEVSDTPSFKRKKDLIIISHLHRTAGAFSTRLALSEYDAELCHTIINESLTSISHLNSGSFEDTDVVLLGWRDMDIRGTELLLERVGNVLQTFSGTINFYLDEYPTNEPDWKYVVNLANLAGKPEGGKIGFAHELLPSEDDHTDEEFAMKEVDDLRCRYKREFDSPRFAIAMNCKDQTKTLWITREFLDDTKHGVIEDFVAKKRKQFRESVDNSLKGGFILSENIAKKLGVSMSVNKEQLERAIKEFEKPKHLSIGARHILVNHDPTDVCDDTEQFFNAVVIHNGNSLSAEDNLKAACNQLRKERAYDALPESPLAFGKTFDSHALRYTQLKDHS